MSESSSSLPVSESFVITIIGAVGALISLVFASLRKSRCGDIVCCFGCFKCKREVLTADELKLEPPSPKV